MSVPHYSLILSPREIGLVRLFGFGWSHAKVGAYVGRSKDTIKTHHANILRKLELHSRPELMRWAIKSGLTDFSTEPVFELASPGGSK